MAELVVDGLSVALGGRAVVRDASWCLAGGELVALLGANGAGKTTALRAVLGLTPRAGGVVRVEGVDPARMPPSTRARRIAYLPQIRPLAWRAGARRRGAGPVRPRCDPGQAERRRRGRGGAGPPGVRPGALAERFCSTLSGGELARVHVARTLAAEAPLLLADEPTASLDPLHQFQVMQLLRAGADAGRGVLVVMHDAALAARTADRLLWMAGGRIVADGPPEATLTAARLAEVYGVRALIRRIEQDWLVSVTGAAANGG